MSASILIVDDEEPILTSLTSILQDEGYEVAVAKNGVEALRALLYPEAPLTFPLSSATATLLLFSLVMFALALLMANRRTTRPAA